MNLTVQIEYSAVTSLRGPLLVVDGVSEVGWDEVADVRLASGEVRHGVVLDIDRNLAVIEVLEGTAGLRPGNVRVSFSGAPMRVPVGEAWLGRMCNGRGEPIDGGPPVIGSESRPVAGLPINPWWREPPRSPILTGVTAVDGLATLVRGQKLPIFSVGGLPHLELAAQIAAQATAGDEPFAVVFAALGISHADVDLVHDTLDARAAAGDLVLFVNTADDPLVERIVTPRLALTVAEHLAFDLGRHVLVVMADVTSYCEAVREVASVRGEVPSRRGYPGYLYSDLASIYERAGRIRGRAGSLTQVPVLTMPAGDITHPVPDLTGYITEGQLVLSADLHRRGIYPPFDALSSLSRMMRLGAGPGRTRDDHLEIAGQLIALVAQARQIADLADVVGADALSEGERRYLSFMAAFEMDFVAQSRDEARSLEATLDRAWRAASLLPRRALTMVAPPFIDHYYTESDDAAAGSER
ncbi:MAG TPA: V-type ATP synthase subunit B [Gaiellaceae bacterium]|nr:V-type ATP synthase subunit B [Gaiellaceae bacterium]